MAVDINQITEDIQEATGMTKTAIAKEIGLSVSTFSTWGNKDFKSEESYVKLLKLHEDCLDQQSDDQDEEVDPFA